VKSNVTQLVDRLEADGLVSRAADPVDRRSRLAVVTAAGRQAWERGRAIHQDAERELFAMLTDDEGAALSSIAAKLERSAASRRRA
jgi:DNA-binding MarR family transcriptional regulator